MPRWKIAVAALLALSSLARAGEQTDRVMERFDKQVELARIAYDKAVGRAVESTVPPLLSLAERSEKSNAEEARAAYLAVLRLDHDNEKAREYFTKKKELELVLTKLTLDWSPIYMPWATGWDEQVFYETMLGRYNSATGTLPLVSLVSPNGTNVLNDAILGRMRSVVPGADPKSFSANGRFIAPVSGEYTIKTVIAAVTVDGNNIGLSQEGGVKSVNLEAGEHLISMFNNTFDIRRMSIEIWHAKTRRGVPMYNSLADIKRFLTATVNGRDAVDVSGWDPNRARPLPIVMPEIKPVK